MNALRVCRRLRNYILNHKLTEISYFVVYIFTSVFLFLIFYTVSQITAVLSKLLLPINNPLVLKETQVRALLCFSMIRQRLILTMDG